MAIEFTIQIKGDLLVATARGFDESLDQVKAYGLALIEATVESGCQRVLCNELDLEYRLTTFDTHAAAKFIAENVPNAARVAIVCKATSMNDAEFWETVAVNHGLTVRAFRSLEMAYQWIES